MVVALISRSSFVAQLDFASHGCQSVHRQRTPAPATEGALVDAWCRSEFACSGCWLVGAQPCLSLSSFLCCTETTPPSLEVTSAFTDFLAMPTITKAKFLAQPALREEEAASSSSARKSIAASLPPIWISTNVRSVMNDETKGWQQTYVPKPSASFRSSVTPSYQPIGYPTSTETLAALVSPSRKLILSVRPAPVKEGAAPAKGAPPTFLFEISDTDPASSTQGRVLHSISTAGVHGRVMFTGNLGGYAWGRDEKTFCYMAEPKAEDRKAANYFPSLEEEEKQRAQAGPSSAPTKGTQSELQEDWGEQMVGIIRPRPFVLRWTESADSLRIYAVKGIPDDVSAGQVIFSGWSEKQYRSKQASPPAVAPAASSVPSVSPSPSPASPSLKLDEEGDPEHIFDEGLYTTIYPEGARKLGLIYYNSRPSKICYLSAKWIVDPIREAERKRRKERATKASKDWADRVRRESGLPEPTEEEEAETKKADQARLHAEAEREKKLNRLIVLTPNDHSAQSPRLDGFSTPQLLYITTDPVWHHCACSSLKTFITLPATLGLFMRSVVEPPYEGSLEEHSTPRVFESNTHCMLPVVQQPATIDAFPGLWPYANVLPPSDAFVFDEKHIVLHSTWRSQNVLLLCSDEDDSLSRLPLPIDAPAHASFTLHDIDRVNGRLLVGVSSMTTPETLYVAELNILGQDETVRIGDDFLPVCVVHKDGSQADGSPQPQASSDEHHESDVAYAQVRYLRVLNPAQPLHPEAQRRLARCRMEVVQVPVPADEKYPDGSAQLPYEAVLLTSADGSSDAPLPPLLAFPHGGPHGCNTTNWIPHCAYMAAAGFSVLYINFRGSTGFGQRMLATLPGKCGTQDVNDCIRAVELLLARTGAARVCDRSSLHVQGGSHGGFLCTHLIGQRPDLFQTAVARNPVCSLSSTAASSDIPDWAYLEGLGKDWDPAYVPSPDDYARMLAASPLAHVKQVRTPLLMLLGGADRRVPPAQALDYLRLVKAQGVRTRALFYQEGKHPLGETISMEADVWVNMVSSNSTFARTSF
jgi:pimeloyl-ACP methyl ester carboxylesterase